MQIPKKPEHRQMFYWEIIEKCMESRESRSKIYAKLRSWYMFGTDFEGMTQTPRYNKLNAHIQLLSSYLFSADTVRFVIELGAAAPKEELAKIHKMKRRLHDEWHDSRCDMFYDLALVWGLVYGTMLIKPLWKRGKVTPFLVYPHLFGVYEEHVNLLERQQAFCEVYYATKTQLARDLEGHPNLDKILSTIPAAGEAETDMQLPSSVQNIIINQSQPNVTGSVPGWWSGPDVIRSTPPADTVKLYELKVWNDEINDFQSVTVAEGGVVIFDRKNIGLPQQSGYVQVTPKPAGDYFWGESEIPPLVPLQSEFASRIMKVENQLDKIMNPPIAITGYNGPGDEIMAAINSPGGFWGVDEAGAKFDKFTPPAPTEAMAYLHDLDGKFSEESGMSPTMAGLNQPGVRGRGQTDTLARLGSSRIKKRAMIVEDSVEDFAGYILRLIQAFDTKPLEGPDGIFLPTQFTDDFTVRVDAHSNSPVFVEDEKNLAFSLAENKTITRSRLVQMIHPSMEQEILAELEVMEKKEEEAQAKEQALAAVDASGKQA